MSLIYNQLDVHQKFGLLFSVCHLTTISIANTKFNLCK